MVFIHGKTTALNAGMAFTAMALDKSMTLTAMVQ